MAQPNMVREPSMDEILASIRRIIESNEPVTQSNVATAMAEPEGFSGSPANDDAEEVTLTVDGAFEDEDEAPAINPSPVLRAVAQSETLVEPVMRDSREPAPQQPAAATPQRALSLADVAARVRAASERSAAGRDSGYSPADMLEKPAPQIVAEPVEIVPPVSAVEPVRQSPVADETPEAAAYVESVADFAPVAEQASAAEAEPATVSLLSSSVGEQVARSFQDLAFAIDNAERRSFDEIAEEMLRPMLQEWLDDNLPTLVERLVREEIERVARGPRR